MAGMRAVDPRVSYAELARWPDDGRRYELYDGEAIVVPAPNWRHQRIVKNVATLLDEYEHRAGGGIVFAPFDIVLSEYDVLQPDVVYFGAAKRARLDPHEAAYVVPDLAVEVLSRSTARRDRGRKMELLARYGLPEYWLVDPDGALEVYASGGAPQLFPAGVFESGPLVSPTLSGLSFDVARLFED
jgi:Uma2 family endonuclease